MKLIITAIESVTQDSLQQLIDAIDSINGELAKVKKSDLEYGKLLAATEKLNNLSVDSNCIDDPDCFITTVLAMKYLELREHGVSHEL